MTWRPDCMDAAELALWQLANRTLTKGAVRPCVDCPAAYAAAMDALGRCNRPARGRPPSGQHSPEVRAAWAERARAYRERRRVAA